ncbi:hypothetical protein DY000_02019604 [Brassica cretica]|uniref:MYB-CC type transcription factor LHEQLE-containing domain-containing protein n=1 Tax=Brassica cretica TaxID=69181 RepID=A0ABQ7CMY4_BRACR|nr:hypothetical protein DY000_02019604 [Brassica cretica]
MFLMQNWQSETLMDNINFESSNASQGSRLQAQQPFHLQDVNMIHFNQSSPWTTETFSGFTPYDCTVNQYFPDQYQRSRANDFAATNASSGSYTLSFEASQDPQELSRKTYSSSNVTPLNFSSSHHQPKQTHPKFSPPSSLSTYGEATPKAILKLMDSEGLTIFHVKSHLQKYRIVKYIPESQEGSGVQIKEALQVQLDVQRDLHEQLEIQRNLQLRIEEQGKQLKIMIEQQQKTKESLLKTPNAETSSSLSDSDHSPRPFSVQDA